MKKAGNNPQLDLVLAIKHLWRVYDESEMNPTHTDETWYIINAEFIIQLQTIATSNKYQEVLFYNESPPDVPNIAVQNRKLLELPQEATVDVLSRLRNAYRLESEFFICSEAVWNEVKRNFKFDVAIPRNIYRNSAGQLKVEIQPLKITIYKQLTKLENFVSVPVDSLARTHHSASRCTPINEFLEGLRSVLSLGKNKNFLLYYAEYTTQDDSNYLTQLKRVKKEDERSTVILGETAFDESTCILAIDEEPPGLRGHGSFDEFDEDERVDTYDSVANNKEARGQSSSLVGWISKFPSLNSSQDKGKRGGMLNFFSPSSSINSSNGLDVSEGIGYSEEALGELLDTGGLVGLFNLGNTCFMNSALQCLSKVQPLTVYFLKGQFANDINKSNHLGTGGRLASAYYKTLKHLWAKGNNTYAPRELKRAIGEKREEFLGYHQQDSQELLAALLDGLHEDLNRIKKRPYFSEKLEAAAGVSLDEIAVSSWDRHRQINDSIIVDLFQGQYKSRLRCPSCGKISITFDPFMYLSLPIPTYAKQTLKMLLMVDSEAYITARFVIVVPRLATIQTLKNLVHDHINYIHHDGYSHTSSVQPGPKQAVKNGLIETAARIGLKSVEHLTADNIVLFSSSHISTHFNRVKALTPLSPNSKVSDIVGSTGKQSELQTQTTVHCYLMEEKEVKSMEEARSSDAVHRLSHHPYSNGRSETQMSDDNEAKEVHAEESYINTSGLPTNGIAEDTDISKENVPTKSPSYINILSVIVCKEYGRYILHDLIMPIMMSVPATTTCEEFNTLFGQRLDKMFFTKGKDVYVQKTSTELSKRFRLFDWELKGSGTSSAAPPNMIGLPNDSTPVKEFITISNKCGALCVFLKYTPPPSIDTVRMPDSNFEAKIALEECLELFAEEEQLDKYNSWFCSTCRQHVEAYKKLDLWKLPSVLILHLKRFSKFSSYYRAKISSFISFPHKDDEVLDMAPFVDRETRRGNQNNNKSLKYKLIGVNCHSGGLGCGHYCAYTKTRNQWVEFSDAYVSKSSADRAHHRDAYLLFYKLITDET